MNDQPAKIGPRVAAPAVAIPETRAKFRALAPVHMPKDFSISLDALRRGGTDAFIGKSPTHAKKQSLAGFEPHYANIVDYIVRITHRIWEEKDIGYIYDTYSHDCMVWDDAGLGYGRDAVVAHTVATNNAFPDIRIVADEAIWAGDESVAFHTSHRTKIFGTNTGYSRYGAATGRRMQIWCMANCVARDNEIFHEHVVYDTTGLLLQLGFDPVEMARRFAPAEPGALLPPDFQASEPARQLGQSKPASVAIPTDLGDNPEEFVRAALHTIWNRRNFGALDKVFSPAILSQSGAGRVFRGTGELRSFYISLVAMFPDMLFAIDDLYWMGNREEGFLVAIRWSMLGTHRGVGRYGEPSGRSVHLWGITHWVVEHGVVVKEWMMFNEFGVLMQVHGGR